MDPAELQLAIEKRIAMKPKPEQEPITLENPVPPPENPMLMEDIEQDLYERLKLLMSRNPHLSLESPECIMIQSAIRSVHRAEELVKRLVDRFDNFMDELESRMNDEEPRENS